MISIFIIIFLVSSHILIENDKENKEYKTSLQELDNKVIKKERKSGKTEINWEELKNINKDIIGWIKIDNTNINYPILQDTDVLYYLNHTYNKKYNRNGSIFTLNAKLLGEEITVIYGHNMENKMMFSELEKYMNKNFFNSHQKINIYTENKSYEAIVFSCYTITETKEKQNIETLDFNEEIEYYKKMSKFSVSNIENITKIVKLSTCSYINSDKSQRYYIVAKIIEI